jgi:hypothetical protein
VAHQHFGQKVTELIHNRRALDRNIASHHEEMLIDRFILPRQFGFIQINDASGQHRLAVTDFWAGWPITSEIVAEILFCDRDR